MYKTETENLNVFAQGIDDKAWMKVVSDYQVGSLLWEISVLVAFTNLYFSIS